MAIIKVTVFNQNQQLSSKLEVEPNEDAVSLSAARQAKDLFHRTQNNSNLYKTTHSFHSQVIWFTKGKYLGYTLKQVIAANAFMESRYVSDQDVNSHIVDTVMEVIEPTQKPSLVHLKDALYTESPALMDKLLSILRHIRIAQIPFALSEQLTEKDFRLENRRVTPENITELQEGQIFVFGSNEAGVHGAYAAKLAKNKFGAIWGKGEGLQGKCYAIPTKDKHIATLPLNDIKENVNWFIGFASEHRNLTFLVTAIGCGAAGYEPKDIAPMFKNAINLENVWLPKSFWNVLNG